MHARISYSRIAKALGLSAVSSRTGQRRKYRPAQPSLEVPKNFPQGTSKQREMSSYDAAFDRHGDLGRVGKNQRRSKQRREIRIMKNRNTITTLTAILVGFACFAFLVGAQAVVQPPDGGYAGGNTAEGHNALLALT